MFIDVMKSIQIYLASKYAAVTRDFDPQNSCSAKVHFIENGIITDHPRFRTIGGWVGYYQWEESAGHCW